MSASCRADKVALVFAVFVVDNNYELAMSNVFDSLIDRCKWHYKNSRSFAARIYMILAKLRAFCEQLNRASRVEP